MGHPAANFIDITGKRFGKRVVLNREASQRYNGKQGSSRWRAKCDCGKETIVTSSHLKASASCGCDLSYTERSGRKRSKSTDNRANKVRAGHLKRTFGMSVEDFSNLLIGQDNKCAICRYQFAKTPCVDHDHRCCPSKRSCGKCVRGLLCFRCNTGLGNFADSIKLMQTAMDYLTAQDVRIEVI